MHVSHGFIFTCEVRWFFIVCMKKVPKISQILHLQEFAETHEVTTCCFLMQCCRRCYLEATMNCTDKTILCSIGLRYPAWTRWSALLGAPNPSPPLFVRPPVLYCLFEGEIFPLDSVQGTPGGETAQQQGPTIGVYFCPGWSIAHISASSHATPMLVQNSLAEGVAFEPPTSHLFIPT